MSQHFVALYYNNLSYGQNLISRLGCKCAEQEYMYFVDSELSLLPVLNSSSCNIVCAYLDGTLLANAKGDLTRIDPDRELIGKILEYITYRNATLTSRTCHHRVNGISGLQTSVRRALHRVIEINIIEIQRYAMQTTLCCSPWRASPGTSVLGICHAEPSRVPRQICWRVVSAICCTDTRWQNSRPLVFQYAFWQMQIPITHTHTIYTRTHTRTHRDTHCVARLRSLRTHSSSASSTALFRL